jgi:hypothetical protein
MRYNKLGLQKVEDLLLVHSNLHLVSHKGEEYTSGPHRNWDINVECLDLELSLVALILVVMQVEVELHLLPIHALVLLNKHLVLFLLMTLRMRIRWICTCPSLTHVLFHFQHI